MRNFLGFCFHLKCMKFKATLHGNCSPNACKTKKVLPIYSEIIEFMQYRMWVHNKLGSMHSEIDILICVLCYSKSRIPFIFIVLQ